MKTILLHVHPDEGQTARLEAALDLARRFDAHIDCVQTSSFALYAGTNMAGATAAFTAEAARQMTEHRAAVEKDLANEDVSWTWQDRSGGPAGALIAASSLADLVILSPERSTIDPGGVEPIVGTVLTGARSPVLVVPHEVHGWRSDAPLMVAWNGSVEAAHALKGALPLVAAAPAVHIVVAERSVRDFPRDGAARYLSRADIDSELHEIESGASGVGAALLTKARELDAGAIVMGAYGRSRLTEFIFGGVTGHVLKHAHLPLVMAH